MKQSPRSTQNVTPADLARRYQRLTTSNAELDLDEVSLHDVACYYRDRTRLDEALQVCDRALQKFPFSVRLYLEKARVLVELHTYEYALEVIEQAETYSPGAPQIHLQRARALAGLGLTEDAFAELDLLGDSDDPWLCSMRALTEAIVFEQLDRHLDMYFFLEQSLRAWPDNAEALRLLWLATELTNRYVQTTALCEWILDLDPFNARAWYNLGHTRYLEDKVTEALSCMEYAYVLDPRFEYAYREAGEICYERQRYAEAVDIYETMMEYLAVDTEVLLRLGQCYYHTGSLTQARLCLNRVLAREPNGDEALFYTGLCYAADEKWDSAVERFRRALNANECDERYPAALASSLVQTGDLAGAEYYFQRATELAPEEATQWVAHAMFLHQQGRSLEAIAVLDEAEACTVGPELDFCRVSLSIAVGREADALRLLAGVLEEDFSTHELLFEIAPELREHDLVAQVIRCFA